MGRRRRHEEHTNHEAWAIPYGDLITLLLAFFVVMYAISSVNEGKYRVVSAALNAAFNGSPHATEPIQFGATTVSAPLPLMQVNRMIEAGLPHAQRLAAEPDKSQPTGTDVPPDAVEAQDASLARVALNISGALAELIQRGQVKVLEHATSVEVQISTDILFDSGVAQISARAADPLQRLAEALRALHNRIRVEGHTDDRPIRTAQFPSNWELSAARAASVVHLFTDRGVDPTRLAVLGLSQYQPLQTNATPDGRNANRRVSVIVLAAPTDRSSPEP